MSDTGQTTHLQWLGINAFRFRHGSLTVLLDPYVTRNSDTLCDPAAVQRHIPSADVILISHSHWDHLADAHEIALRTGATVIGSPTTCHICTAMGVPAEQLFVAEPFTAVQCGVFSVTFYPSRHVLSGGKVPYPGLYLDPPNAPLSRADEYLEGGTFAVRLEFPDVRVLNVGSADIVEQHVVDTEPDVLIAGASKWENSPRYVERLLGSIRPRMVIPCHHDSMTTPLQDGVNDRNPAATARLADRVRDVAPQADFRMLDYFEDIVVGRYAEPRT